MKNRIVDFFPHSTIAESNIFYYNKNSRKGRIYNESGFTDYYVIPNEGLPPFIDSDNDGTIDIGKQALFPSDFKFFKLKRPKLRTRVF